MKPKKAIIELIVLILVLNFFYEGIYKLAYWSEYSIWIHRAPLIRPFTKPLQYLIPIGEIALAIILLIPSWRISALYWTIAFLIGFVIWIACSLLFTSILFWPFHALWDKPSWVSKAMLSLGLSWLALTAIILSSRRPFSLNKHPFKDTSTT